MGTTIDRTAEEARTLISALQQKFRSTTLGEDRWYILAVCHFFCLIYLCLSILFFKKNAPSIILNSHAIPSSPPSSPPANAITRPHYTPT